MEYTYLPESTIRQLPLGRLVFIDPRVEDYQSLAAGVLPDTEVIILRADQDGVEQISEVLKTRSGKVNSLHIVSHGAPGRVYLGNTELSQQTLNSYAGQLMDWAKALTTDAQVLLYGCEVARTNAGKAFVQHLSELTGANVAASDDRTGCAAKGGNWELEVRMGSTPVSLAFKPSTLEGYTAVLAEPYVVKDFFDPESYNPDLYGLTNIDGTLYFIRNGGELWKSDGTTLGTVLVKSFYEINSTSSDSGGYFTNVNSTIYFSASDFPNGGLWKSDGTADGTTFVKNITPWSDFIEFNGSLYFLVNNVNNEPGLWKSDGTTPGTVLVKNSVDPFLLTKVNDILYFTAYDGDNGKELWKSDGTAGGTVLVKDINPGVNDSSPFYFTYLNSTLYFFADDGTHGTELWKSDGTANGTVLVKDINSGPSSSFVSYGTSLKMTTVNNTVYFLADDGTNKEGLWKSDGTAAGTVLVKNTSSFYEDSTGVSLTQLTDVNGTLYFATDDSYKGSALWKTDGTADGTVLVKNTYQLGGYGLYNFTNVNGTLYFTGVDSTYGYELWQSDGTAAGTFAIDINPGSERSFASNLTNVDGTLYFTADGDYQGFRDSPNIELWALNTNPPPVQDFNIINGTAGRDTLTGTNNDDAITGSQGTDILTGGAGSDQFVYKNIRDARDTIIDFAAGTDKIVFIELFQSLSLSNLDYSSAVAGGYLSFGSAGSDSTVLIDPDGSEGRGRSVTLVTVQALDQATLANANNFVF